MKRVKYLPKNLIISLIVVLAVVLVGCQPQITDSASDDNTPTT